MNLSAVPVLMYHSVKYEPRDFWIHKHLTIKLDQFYRHAKLISGLKIKSYFFDALQSHLSGKEKLSVNSIVLTFDDGYLDNYTFVWPLLKKFNIKATIWVNPDFVDNNATGLRPTLEDYWNGRISLEELNEYDGFLTWDEMRLMEKSGLVDIQSHTMTHTKYPVSERIVDFVNPETKIDWLYWNLYPEDKPKFLTNRKYKIPLGYPIYEAQKGNIARRVTEDGAITNRLIEYVSRNGKEQFFTNHEWKQKLINEVGVLKTSAHQYYTVETDEEYEKRIKYELTESKRILETNLGKTIEHVCWPFGGWDETTLKFAKECGYITSTAKGIKNVFGRSNLLRVDRTAIDNPRYQNVFFYPYAIYKLLHTKL